MKKLFILFFLFVCNNLFSQDLIVTNNRDSIQCKIISQQGSFTLYKININGTIQSRALNNNSILKVETNYFVNDINNLNSTSKKPLKETTFNVGIGYTMLFNLYDDDDPDFKDFYRDLSNAVSLHAEVQHSFNEKIGLSLRYDYFKSNAVKNDYQFVYQFQTYIIDIKEEVSIHTLSPGLYYKIPVIENMNIKLFGSYDHNFFDDASKLNNSTFDVFGNKSGFSCGLGYENIIHNNIGLSFQVKYRACKLNKVTSVNSGGSGADMELFGFDRININRLTIGLNVSLK